MQAVAGGWNAWNGRVRLPSEGWLNKFSVVIPEGRIDFGNGIFGSAASALAAAQVYEFELAEQAIASLKGQQGMIVQEYLLKYLLTDEKKHNELLDALDGIKRGVYRSV